MNIDSDYEEPEEDYKYDSSAENNVKELSLDFDLVQMIQQKVSTFSAEKTREQLEKLEHISTHARAPKDLAQLQYEIEACEIHLFELTSETADGCSVCLRVTQSWKRTLNSVANVVLR